MNLIPTGSIVHFIGIGGCSMSALALILKTRGYKVQGSDITQSPFTKRLTDAGVEVFIGHDEANLKEATHVVYTAAIKPENVEREAAAKRGLPLIERSALLGAISETFSTVAAISGCHGKTTITSMLAEISEHGGFDATVHVGSYVDASLAGMCLKSDEVFVTEACEYVESFLTLSPDITLISNIDDDHLDYFKNIDNIVMAFEKLIDKMPENGTLIGCSDDKRVLRLLQEYNHEAISYGVSNADFYPENVVYDDLGCAEFDLMRMGDLACHIKLSIPGEYNMLNAIGAYVCARCLGAAPEVIAQALAEYKLTKRRFEYYGEKDGVKIFHDFAHHPSEIHAVLKAAQNYPHERLFCVLQCNSYTRAETLFLRHPECFEYADETLVVDIYPGRETFSTRVHATNIVQQIIACDMDALYIPTFEKVSEYLDEHAKPGDMVITLGSGDVYSQTRKLL